MAEPIKNDTQTNVQINQQQMNKWKDEQPNKKQTNKLSWAIDSLQVIVNTFQI